MNDCQNLEKADQCFKYKIYIDNIIEGLKSANATPNGFLSRNSYESSPERVKPIQIEQNPKQQ